MPDQSKKFLTYRLFLKLVPGADTDGRFTSLTSALFFVKIALDKVLKKSRYPIGVTAYG